MPQARAAPLLMPRKFVSNQVMAGILVSFVAGSYYWSMHAVGSTDIEKEVRASTLQRCGPGALLPWKSTYAPQSLALKHA